MPSSRDSAIETAARLFQAQGYTATGVAQIIEESGSPKGSFYFNFPGGKEELGVEALTLAGGNLGAGIEALGTRSKNPGDFVRTLTDGLAAGLEASDYERGCPIATVALETATSSDPLRETARTQFAAWEDLIARGLASGARPSRRDRELAAQVLMLLEGGLLMARVQRRTEPLRAVRAALEALVG
jgi:TetR/AcrR family transcriptional repressor of lmrAB and yxaGH operons